MHYARSVVTRAFLREFMLDSGMNKAEKSVETFLDLDLTWTPCEFWYI
jgi:hypothetical protein